MKTHRELKSMEMVKGLGGGIMGRALAASASMSDNHLIWEGMGAVQRTFTRHDFKINTSVYDK